MYYTHIYIYTYIYIYIYSYNKYVINIYKPLQTGIMPTMQPLAIAMCSEDCEPGTGQSLPAEGIAIRAATNGALAKPLGSHHTHTAEMWNIYDILGK